MSDFVSAADFFKFIKDDERVYFLVRHGERDHIRPDDPDHGAFVGLTDQGRRQAFNLGKVIGSAMLQISPRVVESKGIAFFSSPVGRCMQTAEYIGRGFGVDAPCVEPLQPLAEFFVEHYDAYMETHRTGFYQGICRWLDGTARDPEYVDSAYYPLAERSREMLKLMLEKGSQDINIFATHDAWIVPCLNHFCGMKFSPQVWMNFLTGMAVVVRKDCDPMASDAVKRIVPVTALDSGWLRFT